MAATIRSEIELRSVFRRINLTPDTLQIGNHIGSRLVPHLPILLNGARNDPLEINRNLRIQRTGPVGFLWRIAS